jgi:hypothetical protein
MKTYQIILIVTLCNSCINTKKVVIHKNYNIDYHDGDKVKRAKLKATLVNDDKISIVVTKLGIILYSLTITQSSIKESKKIITKSGTDFFFVKNILFDIDTEARLFIDDFIVIINPNSNNITMYSKCSI